MFVTIADQPRLGLNKKHIRIWISNSQKTPLGWSKLIPGGAQTWNARRPWWEPNWCGRKKTVIWWQRVMETWKNMSEISGLIWGWRELNWHDLRIQDFGKVKNVPDITDLEKNRIWNLRQIFKNLEDSQVIRLRNASASVIQRWCSKHVDPTLLPWHLHHQCYTPLIISNGKVEKDGSSILFYYKWQGLCLHVDSCSVLRNKNQRSQRSGGSCSPLSGTTLSRFIGKMSRMNVQETSLCWMDLFSTALWLWREGWNLQLHSAWSGSEQWNK